MPEFMNESFEPDVEVELARLATLVRQQRDECERLRQALAKAEAQRDLYLKAVYEHLRGTFHFEDVDIPGLEAISAGPVETIE
jgi:hypothetical protein